MFLTLHTCFLSPALGLKLGFKICVASCEKEGFTVEQPGSAQHQHTFHYFFLHYLLVTTNGKNFIAIFYVHILCKSLCRLLESQGLSFVFIKLQHDHELWRRLRLQFNLFLFCWNSMSLAVFALVSTPTETPYPPPPAPLQNAVGELIISPPLLVFHSGC